uniref:Cnidarian restricted protein n=1 Tax=Clytia hemisphaerica TaxID=252671 RepID=A0A7M5XB82_9CNID
MKQHKHRVWLSTALVLFGWFFQQAHSVSTTKNLTNTTTSVSESINTSGNATAVAGHLTTTPNAFRIVIFTESTPITTTKRKPPPLPCCRHGLEAGSRGYICIAYPNFVEIRYHLPHPLKMKFDQRTRKFVQLQLARNIEHCARHKIRKTVYESCCNTAQRRLLISQARKKQQVEDCYKRGGQNCSRFYGHIG